MAKNKKELMPTVPDLQRDMVEDKRELASRTGDKYEVFLWWVRSSGVVSLELIEMGNAFEFVISPEQALEAYRHPYSYAYDAGFEPVQDGYEENDG